MKPARYFLDDEREAPEGWVPVRDPRSMLVIVTLAQPGEIEAISFDHDLNAGKGKHYFTRLRDGELTGYWVLNKIEALVASSDWYKDVVPSDLRIHSANAGARKKMEQAIESIRRLKRGK